MRRNLKRADDDYVLIVLQFDESSSAMPVAA
jgi:hypothetical protein